MQVVGDKKSITCFPDSPIGLSSRWLAYATLDITSDMLEQPIFKVDVAKDVGKKVAETLVNTYSRAVSMYRGLEDNPPEPKSKEEQQIEKSAGTIAIYDIVQNKIIYKIRAHYEPIANLTFDQSGTHLSIASVNGNSVNIIRFNSKIYWENGQKKVFVIGKHLYTLHRGYTCAEITNVEFSDNSKWISVQTSKGTIHLFTFNPEFQEINCGIHPPLFEKPNLDILKKESQLSVLSAVYRIYQNDAIVPGIFQSSFIPGKVQRILSTCPAGILSQSQIQLNSTNDNIISKVSVIPEQEWDLSRNIDSIEVKGNFTSISKFTQNVTKNEILKWGAQGEPFTFDSTTPEMKDIMMSQIPLFHLGTKEEIDKICNISLVDTISMQDKDNFISQKDKIIPNSRTRKNVLCDVKSAPSVNVNKFSPLPNQNIKKVIQRGNNIPQIPSKIPQSNRISPEKKVVKQDGKRGSPKNIPKTTSKNDIVKERKESIQIKNKRNTVENTRESMKLEEFCNSILGRTKSNVKKENIIVSCTGNAHNTFCTNMEERMKDIHKLSEATKHRDILRILNVLQNNIDIGILHIGIKNCIPLICDSNLQLEELSIFNSLLPKLLESYNNSKLVSSNIFVFCGIECLHELILKYGEELAKNRPNRLLNCLNLTKTLAEDNSRAIFIQNKAKVTCRTMMEFRRSVQ